MNPFLWWLAWMLFKQQQGASYGKGGVKKRLRLPGHDKTMYDLVFYGDGTRFVGTPRARFWVRSSNLSKPIKVDRGSAADVKYTIDNYPE